MRDPSRGKLIRSEVLWSLQVSQPGPLIDFNTTEPHLNLESRGPGRTDRFDALVWTLERWFNLIFYSSSGSQRANFDKHTYSNRIESKTTISVLAGVMGSELEWHGRGDTLERESPMGNGGWLFSYCTLLTDQRSRGETLLSSWKWEPFRPSWNSNANCFFFVWR